MRADTVGKAPTRIGAPPSLPLATESMPCLSAVIAVPAWRMKISPERVILMPRPSRSNTATPSASSSSRMVLVTAGWLTFSKPGGLDDAFLARNFEESLEMAKPDAAFDHGFP